MSPVRQFGSTWWGEAWVSALEGRASLDPNRLARGRTYARQDRVARLEVERGQGHRARPRQPRPALSGHRQRPHLRRRRVDQGRPRHRRTRRQRRRLARRGTRPSSGRRRRGRRRAAVPRPRRPEAAVLVPGLGRPLQARRRGLLPGGRRARRGPVRAVRAPRGHPCRPHGPGPRPAQRRTPAAARPAGPADARPGGTGPGGTGRMVSAAFGGGAVIDPGMVAREALEPHARRPARTPRAPPAPGTPSAWPADPPRDAPFTADGLTELVVRCRPTGMGAARRRRAQPPRPRRADRPRPPSQRTARAGSNRCSSCHAAAGCVERAAHPPGPGLAQRRARPGSSPSKRRCGDRRPAWWIEGSAAFDDAGIDPDEVQVRSNRFTWGDIQLRVSSDGQWWRFEKRGRSWELVEPPTARPPTN